MQNPPAQGASQHSQNSSQSSGTLPANQLYPSLFQPPPTTQQGEPPKSSLDPEFLQSLEHLKSENENLVQSQRQTKQGFDVLQKKVDQSQDFQRRILEAVNPELARQSAPDPIESKLGEIDRELQYWVEQGMTPDGQRIKLTILNKIENLEAVREHLIYKKEADSKLKKMQEQLDFLSNPNIQVERNMYSQMENMFLKGLEQLYQGNQKMIDIQMESVRAYAVDILQRLKGTEKGKNFIKNMKRDVTLTAQFVSDVLEQTLPPAVLNRLKEEKIMREPITMHEINRGFELAKGIEDPDVRSEAIKLLRWKYYELRNDPKNRLRAI